MQTIALIVLSSASIIASAISLFFSVKKLDKDKIIQQACDVAEHAQAVNKKNGNSLSPSDKKRIAVDFVKQHKTKMNDVLISNKIQAQLQRRIRNA